MTDSGKTLKINCPMCQQECEWDSSNIYRPFCSEKCQLIDMGEWFLERKVISGENAKEDEYK